MSGIKMSTTAMKSSGVEWIGDIPEGWGITKVKFHARIVAGATPKSNEPMFWNGDIPFVSAADYLTEDHYISDWSKTITTEGMNSCATSLLPEDSVVVSNRAPIGLVAIVDRPICTNQGCKGLVFTNSRINNEFVYRALSVCDDRLNALGNGTTYQELSRQSLADFCLPLPPLFEQQQIVQYLDDKCAAIDADIEKRRAIVEKLCEYRIASISRTVSGNACGLDNSHWTWKRFKFIAHVDANLVHPDRYQDWLHICPEVIGKGNGRLLDKRTVAEGNVISDNHLFNKDAILYSKVRPALNKVTIAPDRGLCSADMYPISTSQVADWLFYYMLSDQFVAQTRLMSENRIKMPNINKQELGDVRILVPPLEDQVTIASNLNYQCAAIDKCIERQQQLIDKLEEYRACLIHLAVTGKIDCKEA